MTRAGFAAAALAAGMAFGLSLVQAAEPTPLPPAAPAQLGLSAQRLAALGEHFRREAEAEAAAGYVIMVARDGRLVYETAVGQRDIAHHLPMTLDTRFRIASMTKPVTAAAVLMLYEEGRIHLDDPIARYLPEFADMKVVTGFGDKGEILTEPARRPITIHHLLTHTAGIGYLFDSSTPLGRAYLDLHVYSPGDLAEKVRRIAGVPLYFQPGEGWRYSFADDVLGRLIEVVSGKSFDLFLKERLFEPLGMTATSFSLSETELPLLAVAYTHDGNHHLKEFVHERTVDTLAAGMWPSGGGGLISTAGDYLRFAQMLANGGSLDGKHYLSPLTVALMTRNHVAPEILSKFRPDDPGQGYGLGVGVILDPALWRVAGAEGDFTWGGFFDTHWVASPKTGIVAVIMTSVGTDAGQPRQRTESDFDAMLFGSLTSMKPPEAGARAKK